MLGSARPHWDSMLGRSVGQQRRPSPRREPAMGWSRALRRHRVLARRRKRAGRCRDHVGGERAQGTGIPPRIHAVEPRGPRERARRRSGSDSLVLLYCASVADAVTLARRVPTSTRLWPRSRWPRMLHLRSQPPGAARPSLHRRERAAPRHADAARRRGGRRVADVRHI